MADNSPENIIEIIKSYKDIELVQRLKEDNFLERDERGDRESLLYAARKCGGTLMYHTDIDEIFAINDLQKVKELIRQYEFTLAKISFYRYDLWYNANNYRIERTGQYSGKTIENLLPPVVVTSIFPITERCTYGQREIPNFHCERIPRYEIETGPDILNSDIKVIHYGYYTKSLSEKKGKFYETNKQITGNIWNHDMQIDDEDFIKEWGMGIYKR